MLNVYLVDPRNPEQSEILTLLESHACIGILGRVRELGALHYPINDAVVVLDATFCDRLQIAALARFVRATRTRVMAIVSRSSLTKVSSLVAAGAMAIVDRDDSPEDILLGLARVSQGNHYLSVAASCELSKIRLGQAAPMPLVTVYN